MSNNNNNDIPGLDNILRAIEERGTFARMKRYAYNWGNYSI